MGMGMAGISKNSLKSVATGTVVVGIPQGWNYDLWEYRLCRLSADSVTVVFMWTSVVRPTTVHFL